MLGFLLRIGAALVLTLQVTTAEAAQRPASKARAARAALTNELSTTHIRKGLFAGWIPSPDLDMGPPEPEPPLNHPLSDNRFADKTKSGWTSTLGLLPEPQSKIAIPSPDVRLQERGIHFGAIYRF